MARAVGVVLRRFPDIEKLLVQYVKNDAKRLALPEHKLRPCDLHRIFLRCPEDKIAEAELLTERLNEVSAQLGRQVLRRASWNCRLRCPTLGRLRKSRSVNSCAYQLRVFLDKIAAVRFTVAAPKS